MYIPPYRKHLQNHSGPPRDMGLVCDPSSMMTFLSSFSLLPPALLFSFQSRQELSIKDMNRFADGESVLEEG